MWKDWKNLNLGITSTLIGDMAYTPIMVSGSSSSSSFSIIVLVTWIPEYVAQLNYLFLSFIVGLRTEVVSA